MRPPKLILLVAPDCLQASLIRCVINSRTDLAIISAENAEQIQQITAECSFDMVLCMAPFNIEQYARIIKARTNGTPLACIRSQRESAFISHADAVLLEPRMDELIERMKIMCARKRGPKPVARAA